MEYYAGIGSRVTPDDILQTMEDIGRRLAQLGWCLRSGAANGADSAFELGCDSVPGPKEIFLPWERFNEHLSDLYTIKPEAYEYASKVHPRWATLKTPGRKLHARNIYQVLGYDLNTRVSVVVCWTPDGCERKRDRSIQTGGTGTAISLASDLNVPVYNLANPNRLEQFKIEFECLFGESL
jgi:hypothetical protein